MNLLVAVIAFAGALLAAIATVALVGRLRDGRKGWLIAWSVTTAALCVSLGVVGTGYLVGFGATGFRVYQLTGSLFAPLWLSVGVIQLLARTPVARFASWLAGIAFTVVASVIMMFDPLRQAEELAKTLPLGSRHWDLPPAYVLWVIHVGIALVLLGGLAIAVARWRGGDDYDADNMHALLVLGPTGLAMVGAVSFAVPGMFTTLLLCVTAAAVWYAVLRPLAPYEDEDEDEDGPGDDWAERGSAGRRAAEQPFRGDVQVAGRRVTLEASPRGAVGDSPRRSGLGDLVAEYRAGEQDVDYAARMRQQPLTQDDPFGGPATGTFMAGEYGMPSADRPAGRGDYAQQPPMTGQFGMSAGTGPDLPVAEYGRHAAGGTGEYGRPPVPGIGEYGIPVTPSTGEYGRPGGPATGEFVMPDPSYGGGLLTGGLQPMSAEQAFGVPADRGQGLGGAPRSGQPPAGFPGHGQVPAGPPETGVLYPGATTDHPGGYGRPAPGIYGLLTVFTLLDGTGERFDRLAEETLEAVRRTEPDTLIYACHSVKSAPLQRIVYELYRDEVAYTEHQRQPHVERFVTERQTMVLATNVIELTVNAAKVVPLPTAFRI